MLVAHMIFLFQEAQMMANIQMEKNAFKAEKKIMLLCTK